MASRQKIHDWDVDKFGEAKHQPACLSGHCGYYAESNSCSYRHQGYVKAKGAGRKYKWPATEKGPKYEPPKPGKWDIGTAGNYQRSASKPFSHEAHHIVPHSELNKALDSVGKGKTKGKTKLKVREGLIDEKYNLNNRINMIILPMAKRPSVVLNLPRHRRTRAHWSHKQYSAHVRGKLKEIMQPMTQDAQNCELPQYKKIRKKIENVSTNLYPKIRDAGPIALDDMKLKKPGKGR